MGSFKSLSDANWQKVVPKIAKGYIPFKNSMNYLSGLAKNKQLMRDEIQKRSGISDQKEFYALFSTFDKLPGEIPKTFVEALNYSEIDLETAYENDLFEWYQEVSKITTFPETFENTTHTFYMITSKFPEHLKTIDEKLAFLIQKAKKDEGGVIYHCCTDLYPLLLIYFKGGGEMIVTGRKPMYEVNGNAIRFFEGSQNIALPEFLKESRLICESTMQNYYVNFSLTMKGRKIPMIHVPGKNVRNV